MNSYDARAGVKLGFTTAGTAIGGPIGGAIGNALGTLAGTLIPTKTFLNQKTAFNENVNANMGYSRKDYGTGFKNYFVEEREKATSFSKIADISSDAIPTLAGGLGVSGIIGKGTGSIASTASKLGTQSMPELGAKMGSDLVSKAPMGIEKIASKTIKYIPEVMPNIINKINPVNTKESDGINNGDYSVNPNYKSRVESEFEALNFDKTVNNIMGNIENSPFKMFDETKINGSVIDKSNVNKLESIPYRPQFKLKQRNTPATNALDDIGMQKNANKQNSIASSFNNQYIKSPIEEMNSFQFNGLKTYPNILNANEEYKLEKLRNASGIFTPYNNTYFK